MARDLAGDSFYTRVTLSHLGLIDPADLPRFSELGIVANYTPWWFTTEDGDPVRRSMGDERFERMFDPKSLLDLGVVVTLSSDEWWGGDLLPTYLNPYFGMQIALTRKYPNDWRDLEEVVKPPIDRIWNSSLTAFALPEISVRNWWVLSIVKRSDPPPRTMFKSSMV